MTDLILPLDFIRVAQKRIAPYIVRTPFQDWTEFPLAGRTDAPTRVNVKYELFQYGGSFKARGALNTLMQLTEEQRSHGVVAASGGNHAVASAWGARALNIKLRVVMPKTASSLRRQRCEEYGAEVILTDDLRAAFTRAQEIAQHEGCFYLHPFEGQGISEGTGTLALEWLEQVPDLDAMIVPIGGGGLISGMAAAAKQIKPEIKIFGAEPEGADAITRSLKSGYPEKLERTDTVADSLAAPYALPYSFSLIQKYVDTVVRVSDAATHSAQYLLFRHLKIVAEPATAISTAALLGPLAASFPGQKIGVLLCGSNIDVENYTQQLHKGCAASVRPFSNT